MGKCNGGHYWFGFGDILETLREVINSEDVWAITISHMRNLHFL